MTRCQRVATALRRQTLDGERLTRVPYVMWCVEGSFAVYAGEQEGGQMRVESGEAVVFATGSFVNVEFVEACAFWRLTLEADGVLVGRERVSWPVKPRKGRPAGELEAAWFEGGLRQPEAGLLDGLVAKVQDGPARGEAGQEAHDARALAVLLWELAGRLLGADSAAKVDDDESLLRYLRDQCLHLVNRNQVAAALGISPGYLGRWVRRATGRGFPEVINAMRVEQAKWLLRQTNLSVEQVALRCGFTSANYFAQAFRRSEGVGPRQWRGMKMSVKVREGKGGAE